MKYNLRTPCPKCPFRTDIAPFIKAARCREILTNNAEFACHATVDYDADDGPEIVPTTQHCAGVLIILEREEQPHQMMRICERIGLYDARKLNMDAPVYQSIAEAVEAHRARDRHPVGRRRTAAPGAKRVEPGRSESDAPR